MFFIYDIMYVKNIAIDNHSNIFSDFVKIKRVFSFNLNLPYTFMIKSPKIYIIKMMEDINKN